MTPGRLKGHILQSYGLVTAAGGQGVPVGRGEAAAADTIYALMAPEVHHLLTIERKWDADRYERWLAGALCALLLPQPGASQPVSRADRRR
jgi:hypothetical protein